MSKGVKNSNTNIKCTWNVR